jgi:tetratricopeptide (TPR) repeat protein
MLRDPQDQAQVWHSLGNLLARERNRSSEAEDAYRKSLEMLRDPQDQAQVWHSLGNLLARERNRSSEAEDAYRKSLEMRHDPQHQAQVQASWANALAREEKNNPTVLERATELASTARDLDPQNPHTRAIATKVLADIFRAQGESLQELEMLEELLGLERKRNRNQDAQRTEQRIREIRQNLRPGATRR